MISPRFRSFLEIAGIAAICLLAVVRVASTYRQLCQTYDENDHLACGMQLLDRGIYDYEPMHPVVARIAIALLPYLDGARSHNRRMAGDEGNDILFAQHTYWRTLTLARLGMIPFLLGGIVLLYCWTRKLFGVHAAFLAAFLFSLLPLVLANAGIATTDLPITTMFLAMCWCLTWWMEAPSAKRSAWLGVVAALGTATKFSGLFFLIPVAFVLLAVRIYQELAISGERVSRSNWRYSLLVIRQRIRPFFEWRNDGVLLASFGLTTWALYLFSFGRIVMPNEAAGFERWLRLAWPHGGWKRSVMSWVGHVSIPAPAFFNGLVQMFRLNSMGMGSYFLGSASHGHSSVWFFPVAFLLKTPIPFLLLVVIGAIVLYLRRDRFKTRWMLPFTIVLPIGAVALMSHVNLGLRHLLPLFPFLAMIAAVGIVELWRERYRILTLTSGVLIAWLTIVSLKTQPNFLSYFNEMAGTHPEYYLLDSDLDWGQDAGRMMDTLKSRNVQHVSIAYFGTTDLARFGYPRFDTLLPDSQPSNDWIAISKMKLYRDSGYEWLKPRVPVAKVGQSMLLYRN